MECVCGRVAGYKTNLKFHGHTIDGWKCTHCGEEYHDATKVQEILILEKLQNTTFELRLNKVRSNFIVRIPKEISDVLQLEKYETITFKLEPDLRMSLATSSTASRLST